MIAALTIVVASWTVLACLSLPGWAWAVARLKRRWASREFTDWTLSRPPVPEPDAGWLADQPAEVLPADASMQALEQAVFDNLFRAIPEVADDLRKSGAA